MLPHNSQVSGLHALNDASAGFGVDGEEAFDQQAELVVAEGTLNSIGSRAGYNVTLSTVEKLCRAFDVGLLDLLKIINDPPASARPKRRKTVKKRTRNR